MVKPLKLFFVLAVAGCGGAHGDSASDLDGGAPDSGAAAIPPFEAGASADGGDDAGVIDWTVNGHLLSAFEQAALLVVASDVVPHLQGTRDERLTFAAQGAWWALKEGTWDQKLTAIYAYSNCNSASGDATIGPTAVCGAGRAWQVGLAAVQVPGHTLTELDGFAAQLFPGTSPDALLIDVASRAGETKAVTDAIATSTGSLRISWLLRVPAIGFQALVPQEVITECLQQAKSWCYGSGWPATMKFAPTPAAAAVSTRDLRRILSARSP